MSQIHFLGNRFKRVICLLRLQLTSIATLGSHCALQVLKGAKDEGFQTLLVCEKKRERLYRRFSFIDELIYSARMPAELAEQIMTESPKFCYAMDTLEVAKNKMNQYKITQGKKLP